MAQKRDAEFVRLRNEGLSNVEIADKYGISRERVRQVLARIGYIGKPDLLYKKRTEKQEQERLKKRRASIRNWQKKNPDKVTRHYRNYVNRRFKTDKDFYMRKTLSSRVREALRRKCGIKSARTMDLIGCTVDELRRYLEAKFKPGMNWDNWARDGWHIDHVRPCSSFDLTIPEEQAKCFHYTNLQPLWARENMQKGDQWLGGNNEKSI